MAPSGREIDYGELNKPDIAPIDPELIPDPDNVPFGLPDTAPVVPEQVPTPIDPPFVEPLIPPPPPADVASLPPVEPDVHHTDLTIVFLQDIPAPRSREGTSGQPPSFDPFASAAFPPIPQSTPFTPFTSTPLDEPFRWFLPYAMPISDPYHPSHNGGYTQDELLLSL
ncbi:gibberellin-regulated protein 14-like [Helianthus annuus]|uniref:gibberellin-regulated protein 14-like n=1 Tax=Helianthus annuus TaxID=4232 RepID=UPI000B8F6278|nr:gibberellin-regulated protein 14-like [Helianthus annuus]